MKIREILRKKGHDVVTVGPDHSVIEAVRMLVRHNIGGLVVMEGERPAGIITERDVLRLTADGPPSLESVQVGSVMTRELITAGPDDDLHELMDVMTERRVRHLPVMEDERLVGIVSIGDLVKDIISEQKEIIQQLEQYISGNIA